MLVSYRAFEMHTDLTCPLVSTSIELVWFGNSRTHRQEPTNPTKAESGQTKQADKNCSKIQKTMKKCKLATNNKLVWHRQETNTGQRNTCRQPDHRKRENTLTTNEGKVKLVSNHKGGKETKAGSETKYDTCAKSFNIKH